MTDLFDENLPLSENLTISQEFIQQVRDLLEHLYDFPYLQKQTLVLPSREPGSPLLEIAGQKARKLLLEALETIGGEKSLAFRSSQARYYNLLRLHYIEGMAITDVARELGLSQRQTYRDLRASDERIATIVWANLVKQVDKPEAAPAAEPEGGSPQPGLQIQSVNLNELIANICEIVRPLAASRSVEIAIHLPEDSITTSTDPVVARQVITGLLSMTIQKALPHPVQISLASDGKVHALRFAFQSASLPEKAADPSIGLYAQSLGWQISQRVDGAQVDIPISIHSHQRTCLVIDDHPGFVDLIERYVDGAKIQVITAEDGTKGIELAQKLKPDVILLDVMIPEMDGWQVLQRLRSTGATGAIPVIICSVFYDPDLALTLGAVDVLKKPIRKEDLFAALQKINLV
jgi:CheY-like chemotaxis protein